MQYDGSIRINTNIRIKEAEAQLATLENRMKKTADKITSLRSKMDALKDTKIPTQAYKDIESDIAKSEKELSKLIDKQAQMQNQGKTSGAAWDTLDQKIQATKDYIGMAKEEMQALVNTGKAFTLGRNTEQYANLSQQLQYAENDLAVLNQRYDILRAKNSETESSYVRLGESVRNAFSAIGKGLIDIPIAAVKKGAQSLINIFSKLGGLVKSGLTTSFKKLGNIAKSAFSKITQHANKSSGALSNFGGKIRQIAVSFLIFNQIRKIFSATVNAIKEGFTNLYNDNVKLKSSVDNLKASLLTLKNSLAAAFAPIIEVAIPYIQRLVEWITKAADAVGQLISALMGRKTYTRAIKQSAAASKEAAEATEDETKAINKQLSPLDDLNNLTSENNKENKKSGGEESGTGQMFEEVPISDKWKNIADWLRDMWDKADFYDLGKLLGEKLKEALDNIPWDQIKETARKIGKSIASFINGFIEVDGLGYSIGKTFAEALNTGFEFLNAFVHELHWDSLGKFIAETINGFFQNIDWALIYDTFVTTAKGLSDLINNFVDTLDWDAIATSVSNFFDTLIDTLYIFITETDWITLAEKLGRTISNAFVGIDWGKAGQTVGEAFKAFFSFIATTIENVDWRAVGEKVKEFLVNIDWNSVAESFFEAVGAAIGGFAAFIGGLIGEGVENAKQYFQEKIEEAGGNVVEGILVGIAEALVNIGGWIKEHVFEPFMEGFRKAFQIHSPSKAMESIGQYIIAGLLNGLKNMWSSITSWIEDKVNWIIDKFKNIKNKVSGFFSGGGGSSARNSGNASYLRQSVSPYAASPSYASLADAPIPGYATGQVIPRSMKQHLAILGDNNQETEIVSPVSTMKQAFMEAFAEVGISGGNNGGGGTYQFSIDGRVFFEIMQKYAEEYKKQSGGSPAFG